MTMVPLWQTDFLLPTRHSVAPREQPSSSAGRSGLPAHKRRGTQKLNYGGKSKCYSYQCVYVSFSAAVQSDQPLLWPQGVKIWLSFHWLPSTLSAMLLLFTHWATKLRLHSRHQIYPLTRTTEERGVALIGKKNKYIYIYKQTEIALFRLS